MMRSNCKSSPSLYQNASLLYIIFLFFVFAINPLALHTTAAGSYCAPIAMEEEELKVLILKHWDYLEFSPHVNCFAAQAL